MASDCDGLEIEMKKQALYSVVNWDSYKESIKYVNESVELFPQCKEIKSASKFVKSLILGKHKEFEKAELFIWEAIEIQESIYDSIYMGDIELIKYRRVAADIKRYLKDFRNEESVRIKSEKSLVYFSKKDTIKEFVYIYPEMHVQLTNDLSYFYLTHNKCDNARVYIDKTKKILEHGVVNQKFRRLEAAGIELYYKKDCDKRSEAELQELRNDLVKKWSSLNNKKSIILNSILNIPYEK